MKIIRRAAAMTRLAGKERLAGRTIGFVPTMGFLHEGHLALVRRAARECDCVVASIFVNPLQFGPAEDFASYPRDLRRDHSLLAAEGVDWLFEPSEAEMYPRGFATRVSVEGLDRQLCGHSRPGHFTGVATVVARLLMICRPHCLYLGRKDYQQARIIGRMVLDLNLGIRVVTVPTVRERDGLAMSSRNTYLTEEERAWAPALYEALAAAGRGIRTGRLRRPEGVEAAVARRLAAGPGSLEYVSVLSADDLGRVSPLSGRIVVAVAYRLGKARLIDNIEVRVPRGASGGDPRRGGGGRRNAGPANTGRRRG